MDKLHEKCKVYELKKAMENKMNIPDYSVGEFMAVCRSVDEEKEREAYHNTLLLVGRLVIGALILSWIISYMWMVR